jgi:hypothetical protein
VQCLDSTYVQHGQNRSPVYGTWEGSKAKGPTGELPGAKQEYMESGRALKAHLGNCQGHEYV